jgi:YidC/Oxa1 family membrane protein insertase
MEITGTTEQINFSPSAVAVAIGESEQAELVYTGTSSTGLVIEKNYLFSSDSYLIETGLKFRNPTDRAVSVRAETVLSADATGKDATGYHQGPVIRTADKLIRQDEGDPAATGTGGLKWIGLEDKYFLSALLPQAEKQVSWSAEAPSPGQARAVLQLPLSLAPGETASFSYGSFIGPKEYDRLVKQGMGLEESIEFGWFDWMAKPALVVLNFFNRFLGNYGLSIIALTVVIKILFYPLTKKSLNSMREMQKMQPQLAALKERYKNDKEKMNKELMELYKRNKINPLGGCLPMLLQIPVFIALYEVLYVAIELRHAPFFFWIQDLSAKDPYYITPILMGATMFLQQKMTPTAMDPTQQKIMMFLPLIFTFMFLTFPSGLVLYWLVNNVLTIGQHYFIYKTPAKARAKA